MEKSDHCICMAGSGNHAPAARYRIEAAVRNELTNPSCASTENQWVPNHKDVQPIKVKDMDFGLEDFSQRKKNYNLLSKQGNMKMLTFNYFAEGLKDVCPESTMFSAFPKPDVDFVTDLVKQQPDEAPENFCSVYDWISKSAIVESFFANSLVNMSKEKCQKLNY